VIFNFGNIISCESCYWNRSHFLKKHQLSWPTGSHQSFSTSLSKESPASIKKSLQNESKDKAFWDVRVHSAYITMDWFKITAFLSRRNIRHKKSLAYSTTSNLVIFLVFIKTQYIFFIGFFYHSYYFKLIHVLGICSVTSNEYLYSTGKQFKQLAHFQIKVTKCLSKPFKLTGSQHKLQLSNYGPRLVHIWSRLYQIPLSAVEG